MTEDPAVEAGSSGEVDAAREQLRGRCEHAIVEAQERARQLAELLATLDDPACDVRALEVRLRQLGAERGGGAGSLRAGRTTIGLGKKEPVVTASRASGCVRTATLGALVEASLARVMQLVAQRVSGILLAAPVGLGLELEKIEVDLLCSLYRACKTYAADLPRDPVLLAEINEQLTHAQADIGYLELGGQERARALAVHVRGLQSRLLALGGEEHAGAKLELIPEDMEGEELAQTLDHAFTALTCAINARFPRTNEMVLEALVRKACELR